ncbi:alpha/beta hydrolase [Sphingomonas sp. NSE70-1]|uniref:Alpha/beta hydrolase n=1 Tax=Sphingomonas caseinilyticus TaxID=2908205 RepID=A0ABT0RUG3_9SPHN|nr:alpha/beta hydrolase [Sphingomonas caseinilyticus]MCL6698674.1 alpha/beta hydrolase [Sphingomonas caseinilyticus]
MNISRPIREELPAWEGDDAPPTGLQLRELAWNSVRLVRHFAKRGPRGPLDGEPVLVIPGFLCSDETTLALRKELAAAGFRVHGWKLGWNLGARADTLDRIRDRVESLGHGRPILVVGWSLGGVYAREFARHYPQHVKAVVTLGAPFSGDPRQNTVWKLYEYVARHPVTNPPIPRITDKPPVPHLAIWSRRDGLIAPRAARGLPHERDHEAELDCHHMAFGVSRSAARKVVHQINNFLKSLA